MLGKLGWVIPVLILSGALGMPYLRDEVPFESIERSHFDAIAVAREGGATGSGPLLLRVNVVGDASEADLSAAFAWLRENANVVVERDPNGAPMFVTFGDLAATSGRATLGATVRSGMAIEFSDPRMAACVTAHEILHFLGLKHVSEAHNIMYPHCSKPQLSRATLEPWQRDHLDGIEIIQATTPRGVETWAERLDG